jgi:rhodanese-related sulfurtransferase
MRRAFIQMMALVLLGTAVGFAYNAASPKGIPVKGGKQAVLEQQGMRMLTTEEVKFYRDQPGTVILDARSAEEYEMGHVAGAANLPLDRFDAVYPQLEKELVKAKMIIIYCSGGSCGTSEEVAKKLTEKGIKSLAIDTDGIPGWVKAKLPIKNGQER